MFVKSLTLKGFKSFAEKTTLVFDRGLSVIVGPNGSGKSNICDAILWVLGEQSAKTLRGQAMEDVIFSGSAARKSVSLTEVTLIFDNTDHTLPVDFSEVAVSRRMYRSGESEYLVCGVLSRLRDVQDILHDTGLGLQTHSIIGQGRLEDVLSGKPTDRRELIEEAADIAKHRRHLERSKKKLSHVDEKLEDVRIVSRELARRLKPLERQVSQSRRVDAMKRELTDLELNVAADILSKLKHRYAKAKEHADLAQAHLEVTRLRAEEKAAHLEELRSALSQKGLFVGDVSKNQKQVFEKETSFKMTERLLTEKISLYKDRRAELVRLLEAAQRDLARSVTEEKTAAEHAEASSFEADAAKLRLEASEAAQKEAADAKSELQTSLHEISGRERQLRNETDREILAYARLEEELKSFQAKEEMFASRIAHVTSGIRETGDALVLEQQTQESAQEKLQEIELSLAELNDRIADALSKRAFYESEILQIKQTCAAAQERLRVLEDIEAGSLSNNPLGEQLRRDLLAKKSGFAGMLKDLIDVDPKSDALVEAYFSDDLAALVCDDPDVLFDVLTTYADLEHLHGCSTLLAPEQAADDVLLADDLPGQSLLSIVTVSRDVPGLLGFLSRIRVVESAREALKAHELAAGFSYLSKDGVMVFPDGRVRVGRRSSQEEGSLARGRTIRKLSKQIPEYKSKLHKDEKAFGTLESLVLDLRNKRDGMLDNKTTLDAALKASQSQYERLQRQLNTYKSEKQQLEKTREKDLTTTESSRLAAARHRSRARELEHQLAEIEQARLNIQKEYEASEATYDKARTSLLDQRLVYDRALSRAKSDKKHAESLSHKLLELKSSVRAYNRELAKISVLIKRLEPLAMCFGALKDAAHVWTRLLDDRVLLAQEDSEQLTATIDEARTEYARATELQQRAQETSSAAALALQKLELEKNSALKRIDELGMSADEADKRGEFSAEKDLELAKKRIQTLESKIASAGPVNNLALAQYNELAARSAYIDEQFDDLLRTRDMLKKIAAAIERKMKKRFMEAFNTVNRNFAEVFGLLFQGGSAHLELTDPDSLAETGIEVIAQPRGKRITKMSLMSGGEKSLTALALLFAVYRVRTVPFYVFDEIEATLDDVNLSRLLGAIDRLKQDTQLIVVSHQRRTMETSDVLYGVTMGTDGVSHVISQKLERGA